MEEVNPKKIKKSPRDRHLFWINYYGSENFGIWVECTKCKKWRTTFQYSESHEVPESWCCSMLSLESGEKGSCNDPEEKNAEPYLDYCPGSIVWAKLEGYPWWPSMVDGDPDTDDYSYREDDGTFQYNVTFLDEKPTRAWIPEVFICPFSETPKLKKGHLEKLRQNRYAKAISKAKERAEAAMKMTIKDRLQTYSFVHSYKGQWPTTTNIVAEECDTEKNGSRNTEDTANIVLKKSDKLGSSDSTSSSNGKYDKKIEKDFSKKKNNTAEEKKLILKNFVIPSLEKKMCNKKLLNKKNCNTENERGFPSMEKKNLNYSASVNETLRNNLVECAESITAPVQEKEPEGIKKKANRKFLYLKEKNFDNPTLKLVDSGINLKRTNSEYGCNENVNTISVPKLKSRKEDNSISIHAPKEQSAAENFQNGLTEIPNYENCGLQKQVNNINPLDKKELKKNINLLECAGTIVDPVEEKEAAGLKRKVNRKFTPRKETKFEKPSQSLADDIIDLESTNSEYESNENLNAVIVPKDASSSNNDLKKSFMTESNQNALNKVSNNEKHSPEKQTNNVKLLNEKVKKGTNVFTDKTTHSPNLSSNKEISKKKDEPVPTVLEFNKNQKFEKCNNLNQKRIRTSNELQQKSNKQKKSQNFLENIMQSNSKITKSEGNINQILQVPPEIKVLPNISTSISKINRQIITDVPAFMKQSQKNIKPNESKVNWFKKQPISSFPVPVKNSAGQNDEVVVDKESNMTKENKILKTIIQKPEKIIILL